MRCSEPGVSVAVAMDSLAPAHSALRAYSLRLHSFRLLPIGSSVASRGQMEQQCRYTAQRMLGR